MIAIPFVVLTFYDSLPSIGEVINLSTISIFNGLYSGRNFSEAISYTPILGASSYLTFITGNIMNLKAAMCRQCHEACQKRTEYLGGRSHFFGLPLRYVRL